MSGNNTQNPNYQVRNTFLEYSRNEEPLQKAVTVGNTRDLHRHSRNQGLSGSRFDAVVEESSHHNEAEFVQPRMHLDHQLSSAPQSRHLPQEDQEEEGLFRATAAPRFSLASEMNVGDQGQSQASDNMGGEPEQSPLLRALNTLQGPYGDLDSAQEEALRQLLSVNLNIGPVSEESKSPPPLSPSGEEAQGEAGAGVPPMLMNQPFYLDPQMFTSWYGQNIPPMAPPNLPLRIPGGQKEDREGNASNNTNKENLLTSHPGQPPVLAAGAPVIPFTSPHGIVLSAAAPPFIPYVPSQGLPVPPFSGMMGGVPMAHPQTSHPVSPNVRLTPVSSSRKGMGKGKEEMLPGSGVEGLAPVDFSYSSDALHQMLKSMESKPGPCEGGGGGGDSSPERQEGMKKSSDRMGDGGDPGRARRSTGGSSLDLCAPSTKENEETKQYKAALQNMVELNKYLLCQLGGVHGGALPPQAYMFPPMPGLGWSDPRSMYPAYGGSQEEPFSSPTLLVEHPTFEYRSWHPDALNTGYVSQAGTYFTKQHFEGRLSMITESEVHASGTHRFCVKFEAGEFSVADGVGYVFCNSLPCKKNIQKIDSIFINKRGHICSRVQAEVARRHAHVAPFEVGTVVEVVVEVDRKLIKFAVYTCMSDETDPDKICIPQNSLGETTVDFSDLAAKCKSGATGHFCTVLKNTGTTVRLLNVSPLPEQLIHLQGQFYPEKGTSRNFYPHSPSYRLR